MGRGLATIFGRWQLTHRVVILFLLYLVGTVLTGCTIILILPYQAAVLYGLCRWTEGWQTIRDGTAAIVGGKPDTIIDTHDMDRYICRELRSHAEQLNDLGSAINSAVEERLNLLNRLKEKYGNTLEAVIAYGEGRQKLLDKLEDYDAYIEGLNRRLAAARAKLEESCGRLSKIRRKHAAVLTKQLKEALVNLNFATVEFEIAIDRAKTVTAKGYDDVEFLISTNPGEGVRALSQVASGGELSRIMLAIKTVLAGRDDIDTLIFDEIDTGISGRTAWRVSEQLDTVAHAHQVLCITHLPQIAAMADRHFVIEKSSTQDNTITDIRLLEEEESLGELARLLGSDTLTPAALSNARDMRLQAAAHKSHSK